MAEETNRPTGTTPAGTTSAGTTPAGTTPAGTTPAGTTPAGTTPAGTTEEQVWTEEELKGQIRSLENQIFIAQKQQHVTSDGESKVTKVLSDLKFAIDGFAVKRFSEAEKHVFDVKEGLIELIDALEPLAKFSYFVSAWGLVPIGTAIFAIIISFILMGYKGYTVNILGIVPFWAPLVAVIGASVQILVGVVNDYKADSIISQYKRLWYIVLPFVSFVFGFIAFLLIQAGLINISQGQLMINQTINQTIPTRLELPIIICFMVGYATDWFMGLLTKLAPAK